MPTYEYKCLDCGKESELNLSVSEHDRGNITCPACKSTRMEQLIFCDLGKDEPQELIAEPIVTVR